MTEYIIEHNYGMCPNQIDGHTSDGRAFYFRGRHGGWSLGFGQTIEDAIGREDYFGDLPKAGWMETDEWEAFFWDVIKNCVESGNAFPQAAIARVTEYQNRWKTLHNTILARSPEYQIPVQDVVKLIRELDPDRLY